MGEDGGGLKSASHYYKNNLLMSFCFFMVFTAFSSIQNLMGAVLSGGCTACDAGVDTTKPNGSQKNSDGDSVPVYQYNPRKTIAAPKASTCAWTAKDKKMSKVCAAFVGKCDNECPFLVTSSGIALPEGGNELLKADALAYKKYNQSAKPDPMEVCPPAPVGNIAAAILYAFFTVCCIAGPLVVEILGAKWSMVVGFSMNTFFCVATVLVVMFRTKIIEEAVMYPASALVGVAASFLWTAQGTYLTRNANFFADAKGLPRDQALGQFNGVFFACFQCTQLSGNLLASVLKQLGLTDTQLFLLYTAFAGAGTLISLMLSGVPAEIENNPCTQDFLDDEKREDGDNDEDDDDDDEKDEGLNPMESIRNMVGLWQDSKMMSIIPLIMYSGLEVSFIWNDFTTNYVAKSLGVADIGYVMAIFGAADVVASIGLGKLSDVVGRPAILIFGALCQGAVVAMLFFEKLEGCNQNWIVTIAVAVVWGFGDAAWNTQICSILGETFVEDKESAFANFKFWQSLTCAAAFGYIPQIPNKHIKLTILIAGLAAGMLGAANLFRLNRLEMETGDFAFLHDKDEPATPKLSRKGRRGAGADQTPSSAGDLDEPSGEDGLKEPLISVRVRGRSQ